MKNAKSAMFTMSEEERDELITNVIYNNITTGVVEKLLLLLDPYIFEDTDVDKVPMSQNTYLKHDEYMTSLFLTEFQNRVEPTSNSARVILGDLSFWRVAAGKLAQIVEYSQQDSEKLVQEIKELEQKNNSLQDTIQLLIEQNKKLQQQINQFKPAIKTVPSPQDKELYRWSGTANNGVKKEYIDTSSLFELINETLEAARKRYQGRDIKLVPYFGGDLIDNPTGNDHLDIVVNVGKDKDNTTGSTTLSYYDEDIGFDYGG